MKYIILQATSIEKLVSDVNDKIEEGFIPSGGITYLDTLWYQPMIQSDPLWKQAAASITKKIHDNF